MGAAVTAPPVLDMTQGKAGRVRRQDQHGDLHWQGTVLERHPPLRLW